MSQNAQDRMILAMDYVSLGSREAPNVEMFAWYVADPSRQVMDERLDQLLDRIVDAHTLASRPGQ